jgi:hypothetical protein
MADRKPSAAEALYPNLRAAVPERPEQQQRGSLASAMYPSQMPRPKPLPDPNRDSLLRNLRELNQRIDERLARERGGRS